MNKRKYYVVLFVVALVSSQLSLAAPNKRVDLPVKAKNLAGEAFGADITKKVSALTKGSVAAKARLHC